MEQLLNETRICGQIVVQCLVLIGHKVLLNYNFFLLLFQYQGESQVYVYVLFPIHLLTRGFALDATHKHVKNVYKKLFLVKRSLFYIYGVFSVSA